MPARELPPRDVTTFQLLAELESYELHLRELARTWQATGQLLVFGEVGRSMERMRKLAAALPPVSAPWVMVMISHAELMHNLWRALKGEQLDLAAELESHLACVDAMELTCRRVLERGAAENAEDAHFRAR